MNAQHLLRQSDIVDTTALNVPLSIIGAGSVGSFTALILAKMGYTGEIHAADFDTIETHNIANQFYPMNSEGQKKVEMLQRVITQFTGISIDADDRRMSKCPSAEAVIFAVDAMDTRIQFWKGMKASKRPKWVFDSRIGAELMRIYTINRTSQTDRKFYESTLYSSANAEKLPCTARTVVYNIAVVAGLIANQVKRALMNQSYKREIIFDLKTLTLLTQ